MATLPHPDPRPHLTELDFPPLRGGPALIQGRYGRRGNFELVAPDAADGLWVFWFNNDEACDAPEGRVDVPAGPPPGAWSTGLRFAHGLRFDDVQMIQSVHGPDHLEVIARSGPTVHRYRWSPEAGFTAEGTLPAPPAGGRVALAETSPDGVLHAAVPLAGSGVALLSADASAYPVLRWRLERTVRPQDHIAAAVLVPDPLAAGRVELLVPEGGGPENAAAATTASFDGARTDIVVLHETRIVHLTQSRGPGGPWVSRTARSRIACPPGSPPPAHRY